MVHSRSNVQVSYSDTLEADSMTKPRPFLASWEFALGVLVTLAALGLIAAIGGRL